MIRKNVLALLCLCYFQISLFSQEQLGLRLDKYSGVNSLTLNPSSGSHFALGWDLNLVGLGIFLENNYTFASPTNIPHFLQNSNNVEFAFDSEPSPSNPDPAVIVDFVDDNKSRYFNLYTEIIGPGLLINIDATHAFGFQTKLRSSFGGFNIDNDLSYYIYENIALGNPLEIEPFSVAGMVWQEYALSYSYAKEAYFGKVSLGASLKLMRAYESFYLNIEEPIMAQKIESDSFYISSFDVSYGFTNASIEEEGFANQITGQGIGIDLGATFLIEEEEGDYFAKIGVALLDLGRVNFDKQTERYALKNISNTSISDADFSGVNSKEEAMEALSNAIIGDSISSRQPAGYEIWAPTAFSIQGDIQVKKNLYVGASWVQRIPFSELSVKRNNSMALFPRFENRWFSIGVPMVLYNWQDFRLGTSVRIGFLTIGSDNLGSFVGQNSLSGTDFYLALKANPFSLNLSKGGNGGKNKGKSVKCFKFK